MTYLQKVAIQGIADKLGVAFDAVVAILEKTNEFEKALDFLVGNPVVYCSEEELETLVLNFWKKNCRGSDLYCPMLGFKFISNDLICRTVKVEIQTKERTCCAVHYTMNGEVVEHKFTAKSYWGKEQEGKNIFETEILPKNPEAVFNGVYDVFEGKITSNQYDIPY